MRNHSSFGYLAAGLTVAAYVANGGIMKRIFLAALMSVAPAFGCSSPADSVDGEGMFGNNSGGKSDNANQTDGGIAETDGDIAVTDGDVPEADSDLVDGDGGELEPVEVDPFEEAWDVHLHKIQFPEGTEAPADYQRPSTAGVSLGGTEFWQKWPNGLNPTYSYYEGTEFGKRCMFASARRFEAIMNTLPESVAVLRESSNWRGSFFNWNDDFSLSDWSDGRSARLWAWRTGLIKWISQTNQDGSCYLPTLEMVETMAENCLEYAERREGEIQGCRAP